MPGFHAGRSPRNKGLRYPADPPKVEEIIAVMRAAGDRAHGRRLRGLIVILGRARLRIQEALALAEADLDYRRGALLVRRGKGGRRREVGMDAWGWDELQPGSSSDSNRPSGRSSASSTVRRAVATGPQPPPAPTFAAPPPRPVSAGISLLTNFRHAHAVEMAREGVPLIVIQRQVGHSNLGVTSVYLQGIDNAEIIETVHARRAPRVPVSGSPQLCSTAERSAARRAKQHSGAAMAE
jgi:integrase